MSGVTVRAILLGDGDPGPALGRIPGWASVLEGIGQPLAVLSPGGRSAVAGELASALAALLTLDVGQLVIGGWRRHPGLVAAATRTQADPSASELVTLATHRITIGHRPYVEIALNEAPLATVHFELNLTFDIDSVVATVRQGRLAMLHGGRCTVTASLACAGRELVSRQVTLDPVATVVLGQGVPLLPEAPRQQVPSPLS